MIRFFSADTIERTTAFCPGYCCGAFATNYLDEHSPEIAYVYGDDGENVPISNPGIHVAKQRGSYIPCYDEEITTIPLYNGDILWVASKKGMARSEPQEWGAPLTFKGNQTTRVNIYFPYFSCSPFIFDTPVYIGEEKIDYLFIILNTKQVHKYIVPLEDNKERLVASMEDICNLKYLKDENPRLNWYLFKCKE